FEQVVDLRLLPSLASRPKRRAQKLRVVVDDRLVLDHDASRDSAADHDARASARRLVDQLLVLALENRVRDLEDVEDTHLDVLLELRNRAGHPDEADLALLLQRFELRDRVVLLENRA